MIRVPFRFLPTVFVLFLASVALNPGVSSETRFLEPVFSRTEHENGITIDTYEIYIPLPKEIIDKIGYDDGRDIQISQTRFEVSHTPDCDVSLRVWHSVPRSPGQNDTREEKLRERILFYEGIFARMALLAAEEVQANDCGPNTGAIVDKWTDYIARVRGPEGQKKFYAPDVAR